MSSILDEKYQGLFSFDSLSLQDFVPPVTPHAYANLLTLFRCFPIFVAVQYFVPWYPQGKTSVASKLNLPGRLGWCLMEIGGPINLIYTLLKGTPTYADGRLPWWNVTVAGLYVLHYLNRAIITPLFFAPSMSPIHTVIVLAGASFNYFASTSLAGWLLGYGAPIVGVEGDDPVLNGKTRWLPWFGVVSFLLGMALNIRCEHTLFRLRREAVDKVAKEKEKEKESEEDAKAGIATGSSRKNKYDKIYVLPPAKGLFKDVLFPHYFFEWYEWLGLTLVGVAVAAPSGVLTPKIPDLGISPVANFCRETLGVPLPLPPLELFFNIFLTTALRARAQRKWYAMRFGEENLGGRGNTFPSWRSLFR